MIAALLVWVSPSALLPDVSSCYASPNPGGDSRGGGTDQGDADGLSGMGSGGSDSMMIEQGLAPSQRIERVMILVGMWWKYMIWMR
jgi:hypothetical protein